MKKRLTNSEKLLFTSPLLFLALVGVFWVRQKSAPLSFKLPDGSDVWQMRFSPDGRRLMALITDGATSNITIRVFDLESRTKLRDLSIAPSHSGNINYWSLDWSSDGKQIVSLYSWKGSKTRTAIWDVNSGEVQGDYPFDETLVVSDDSSAQVKFSADGKTLIGGGGVLDVATGKYLDNMKPAKQSRKSNPELWKAYDSHWEEPELGLVTVRKNSGQQLLTTSRIWVIDSKTKRSLWQPPVRNAVDFKWGDKVLALLDSPKESGREDTNQNARLLLWDGKTRKPLISPPMINNSGVTDFQFHPDGRSITYSTHLSLEAVS